MRIAILSLACLWLCGCPRQLPPEDPRAQATGTHPWQSPRHEQVPFAPRERPAEERSGQAQDQQPALGRGPAFAPGDNLDVALIPGTYLQVCEVITEKMNVIPVGHQDLITLSPGGSATYRAMTDFQAETIEGRWEKTGPGVLSLALGGTEAGTIYAEMRGSDFLYFWSYEKKIGFWYARLPEEASSQVLGNSFETNRGHLRLVDVVGSAFSGVVEGKYPMTVSGFYQRGVLAMRWEQDDRTAAGFAMFVLPSDWNSISGVWWLDDYEAAPFGGDWSGVAK